MTGVNLGFVRSKADPADASFASPYDAANFILLTSLTQYDTVFRSTGSDTAKSTSSSTWWCWRPRRSRRQYFAILQRRFSWSSNRAYHRSGGLSFLCWNRCIATHYWKIPFLSWTFLQSVGMPWERTKQTERGWFLALQKARCEKKCFRKAWLGSLSSSFWRLFQSLSRRVSNTALKTLPRVRTNQSCTLAAWLERLYYIVGSV